MITEFKNFTFESNYYDFTKSDEDWIIKNIEKLRDIAKVFLAKKQRVKYYNFIGEGYVDGYTVEEKDGFKFINVTLKYLNGQSVITGLKRVSKPGLRVYSKAKNMPRVFDGMGIAVISTSKGLMTEKAARANKLGGEVLCYVW